MSKITRALFFFWSGMLLFQEYAFAKRTDESVQNISIPIIIEVAATVSGALDSKHGVYLFKIHCALGACSLERISLNECMPNKEGKLYFVPKTYIWTSQAGFLKAELSKNVLELTVFQATHHQLPARVVVVFDVSDPPFTKLKSFEAGGFIDFMKWPDTDMRIQYTALPHDQLRQLDCPIFLPGIN
ncbi:hypothetical protein ABZN20_13910 [Methylococcus sp. ANG]|uniref:hypothetical protein n=1 Tax=Methylococcus sp. ANG TaxID=3231903 RepID=UPI00345982AC